MADSLRFILELVDRASPAAKSAARGFESIKAGLGKIQTNPIAKGLASVGKTAASAALTAAKAYAALSLAIAGAGAAAAVWGFKQIAEQQNNDLALRTVIKDTKQLDAAFAAVKGISSLFGTSPDEIEKEITKLILKGHQLNDAVKIVQGAHDLKVLGADVHGVIDAFTALDDKGKVSAKTIAALAGAGLDPGKLRAVLGAAIGSSGDLSADIEQGIKAGTLDSAALQAAALKTITEMTGKELGGLAIAQSKTLGGLWERFLTIPDRLFDQLDISKVIEPATKAMDTFIGVLSGPAGQSALQAIVDGFSSVLTYVSELATADNIGAVVDVLRGLGSVVGQVVQSWMFLANAVREAMASELGKSTIENVRHAFEHVWKLLQKIPWKTLIGPLIEGLILMVDQAAIVIDIMGYMVEGIMAAIDGIADGVIAAGKWIAETWDSLTKGLGDFWDDFVGFFTGLPDKVWQFGADIVNGLWEGIKAAWAGMIEAFSGLVDLLPDAVKKVLGIASPSKVMMQLGGYTAEGFNVGLQAGAAGTPTAFADVVKAPEIGALAFGAAPASTQNSVGDVNVYIGGDAVGSNPAQAGRAIGVEVRREVLRYFDDLQPA